MLKKIQAIGWNLDLRRERLIGQMVLVYFPETTAAGTLKVTDD